MAIIDVYVRLIEAGRRTLGQVPEGIREQVRAAYNEKHPEAPLEAGE